MIKFDVVSRVPRALADCDWQALGKTLGRRLKLRHPSGVGLKFVSTAEMRKLNRTYRKIDRPTDVLSFETAGVPDYLGDIVICPVMPKPRPSCTRPIFGRSCSAL